MSRWVGNGIIGRRGGLRGIRVSTVFDSRALVELGCDEIIT
jgi:hypothetical protein